MNEYIQVGQPRQEDPIGTTRLSREDCAAIVRHSGLVPGLFHDDRWTKHTDSCNGGLNEACDCPVSMTHYELAKAFIDEVSLRSEIARERDRLKAELANVRASLGDGSDAQAKEICRLKAELAAERERAESLERDLATQVYRGNSVGYIHAKMEARGKVLSALHETLATPGEDVREAAKRVVKERDAARAELAAEREAIARVRKLASEDSMTLQSQRDAARAEVTQWKERAEKAERSSTAYARRYTESDDALRSARAEVEKLKKELAAERERAARLECKLRFDVTVDRDAARAQAAKLAGLLRDWLVQYEKGRAPDDITLADTREIISEFDVGQGAHNNNQTDGRKS